MRKHRKTVLIVICLSALLVATAGCSTSNTSGGGQNGGGAMMGGNGSSNSAGGGMTGRGSGAGTGSYSSVGEQIYVSGVGSDGQAIERTAPAVSQGSMMMGGDGCGSCHAANGRGGTIRMMMGTAIEAPDVTYDALIKEGFTDATIKRAIRDGLDEAGEPLDDAMPRWQMSAADADATIAYLKQLGTQ